MANAERIEQDDYSTPLKRVQAAVNGFPITENDFARELPYALGPLVAFLADKALQPQRPVSQDVEAGKSIVRFAASFDHRRDRAVMNAADLGIVVLMAMPLQDGGDLSR